MRRTPLPSAAVLFAAAVLSAACPGEPDEQPTPADCPDPPAPEGAVHPAQTDWPDAVGPQDRRATVHVPDTYDGRTALPVVFLLHGYGANGDLQDFVFRFQPRTSIDGFILVLPDGTENSDGRNFWNATDACCDFEDSGVDDVGYLTGLLDELEETFRVDSSRVYFTGHSNGGYMSYRMACEIPERVAAILSLAGATFLDDADCAAELPVSVLQVHGDEDATVEYGGGPAHPGAVQSVETWAARAGCATGDGTWEDGGRLDLLDGIDTAETTVRHYNDGCACGVGATLWTIEGGGHVPGFNSEFAPAAISWLFEHRRD